MVMLSTIRSRLLLRKLIENIVMNIQRNKKLNDDPNTTQSTQSTLRYDFSGDSVINTLFNIQRQGSRNRQTGEAVLIHNSSCRFNPAQQSIRPLTTYKRAKPLPQAQLQGGHTHRLQKLKHKKAISHDPVPLRRWITLSNDTPPKNSFTFKLMCYNVLSQLLLEKHRDLYPDESHRPQYLTWNNRWNLLKDEFQFHNATILCLQEVQENHYKEFYYTFLKDLGYEGIFKKRTRSDYPDGCAIFYKKNILTMIEHHSVEYFQPRVRLLDRDNVALIAKFIPYNSEHSSFVVANTHLLFNPKREDVRLAQMQVLLTEINRFSYDYKTKLNVPVILCGDLNSHSKSHNSVYKLIMEQMIEYTKIDSRRGDLWLPPELGITNDCWHSGLKNIQTGKELTRSEEEKLIHLYHSEKNNDNGKATKQADENLFKSGQIFHDFNFKSVYDNSGGVSTNHLKWIAVDHMFYSSSRDKSMGTLKLRGLYELPTEDGINDKRIKGIPNCKHGSDHFSLIAKFQFGF